MPALDIDVGPKLSEEEARKIFAQGEEVVVFALLKLAQMAGNNSQTSASDESPSTPSGMKPPYKKPPTKRRGKKPGAKPGHPGARRQIPDRIDLRETHRADRCPDCDGKLNRCDETRTRYTEDIPENISPKITEHTIHRDWCPNCKKKGRAEDNHCVAQGRPWQSRSRADRLVALCFGQYAVANCRGI